MRLRSRSTSIILLLALLATAGAVAIAVSSSSAAKRPAPRRPKLPPAPRTVAAVIDSFARVARGRYEAACRKQKIAWPPKRLTLLAFKRERTLEVWGAGESGGYARLATYRIVAASGKTGPKRREGDKQVPEGIYSLPLLNPNSSYHLSIKVGYPNGTDIANATIPTERMGGDIYIHGRDVSIGCLAIGDRGIEELFTLAALVPAERRRIIIAPFDFRRTPGAPFPKEAAWVHEVYRKIKGDLRGFPLTGLPPHSR